MEKYILSAVCILLITVNLVLIGQAVHCLRSHPEDVLEKHLHYLLVRLNAMTVNFAVVAVLWLVLTLLF
jgi:hypothetical protein